MCNYWRWCFQLSNLIKTNAKLVAYIFDYNSSWKDERTQPGSDHWKSMHHFGQCTTVLLSTKHFCGVLLYTKHFCILNILALHWNTQEENSCALQRGRSIGGRSLSKLNNHKIHSQFTDMATWKLFGLWLSPILHLWWRSSGPHGGPWVNWQVITRAVQTEFLESRVLSAPSISCWRSTCGKRLTVSYILIVW